MELTVTHSDPIVASFLAMDESGHRESIASLRGDIGQRILHLGKAVLAWKVRGKDLDELGMNGMTYWLLRVGGDQLYAPLLARTMRDKKLTKMLERLPFEDQKHIGDGGKVDLLVMTERGPETIAVDPTAVTDHEVLDQLFEDDRIRTVAMQRIYLASKQAKAKQPAPESVAGWDNDTERQVFKKGRATVSYSEIESMYRAIKRHK